MAIIKAKMDLVFQMKDIKQALEQRGLVANQANINRLVRIVKDTPIRANIHFFETVPVDRETLLMYGFTFRSKGGGEDG